MPTQCNTKPLESEGHEAASAGAGWIDNFRLWGSSSWRQMTAI